jgi:hypothetical protein
MRASFLGLVPLLAAVGLLCTICPAPASAAPEGTVSVTVHDAEGAPIPGATVTVRTMAGAHTNAPRRIVGAANDDGVARLAGVPTEPATLLVTPPVGRWMALADVKREQWTPRDEHVVLPPALTIRGVVVTPSGQPAPQAEIRLGGDATFGQKMTIARLDGTFEISRLPPGEVTLTATVNERDWNAPDETSPPTAVRAGDLNVKLTLASVPRQPRQMLVVRVISSDGRPVHSGYAVFAHGTFARPGHSGSGSGGMSSGSFDGGAATDLNVHNAQTVEVSGPRSRLGEELPGGPGRAGPYGPGPADVTIRLPPERFIEGRVTGPRGAGVAGVKIGAVPAIKDPMGEWAEIPVHGETITREDGTFRVGGLGDGTYRLHVHPPDDFSPLEPVSAQSGGKNVAIALTAAHRAVLTVLDPEGEPLRAATIEAEKYFAVRGFDMGEHPRAVTNAEGVALLKGLIAGQRYNLTVYPPLERKDVLEGWVEQWDGSDTTIRLSRAYRIAGVVQDESGAPVPHARIRYARGVVPGGTTRRANLVMESSTVANEDGTFALEQLEKTTFRIWCAPPLPVPEGGGSPPSHQEQARAFRGEPVEVEAGTENVVLRLVVPRRIAIRVADWKEKYGEVTARLVEQGAERAAPHEATIDAEGAVAFDGLDANRTYALWIGPVGKGRYALLVDLEPSERVLDVTLQEGGTIKGRLRYRSTTRDNAVWVETHGFRIDGRCRGNRYELTGLPRGTWTLHATARSGETQLVGMAQSATGETTDIEMRPR